MPTGYTAAIEKGIEFNEFAMSCARAFGALITMRDEPHDAKIPERFEPSDYHLKNIERLEAELFEIKGMSIADANLRAQKKYDDEVSSIEKAIRDKLSLAEKYNSMLFKVRGWVPPSNDHKELKKFMEQQITESLKWDCGTSYYTDQNPVLLSGEEWKEKTIEKLSDDIRYHRKEYNEEVGRAEGRNTWLKQLRESLPSQATNEAKEG